MSQTISFALSNKWAVEKLIEIKIIQCEDTKKYIITGVFREVMSYSIDGLVLGDIDKLYMVQVDTKETIGDKEKVDAIFARVQKMVQENTGKISLHNKCLSIDTR